MNTKNDYRNFSNNRNNTIECNQSIFIYQNTYYIGKYQSWYLQQQNSKLYFYMSICEFNMISNHNVSHDI